MKYDDIHFNCNIIDGYNKDFNFIQSARSTGKTTDILRKAYKYFKLYNKPTIILRRNVVDINELYIDDLKKPINKFIEQESDKINFYYKSSALGNGIVDIYLSEAALKNKTNPFIRLIALSKKMQSLKGGVLDNVGLIIYDEYIIDVYNGEKYLPNEVFKFKEIYNTYQRESSHLKCYFLGNIYSTFNPFHEWKKIPYDKISDGCILSGDDWIYNKYKLHPALREQLLKNPLYKDDPVYTDYALNGIAVNDLNKIIVQRLPQNYKMAYLFKTQNKWIAVYRCSLYQGQEFLYWAGEINWNPEYARLSMCFDFANLGINSFIPDRETILRLLPLKYAIMNRSIAYDNIGTSYTLEYLYSFF